MPRDPILDEVRQVRDAIAKEHSYDVKAIVRALQEAETRSGRELVASPAKRIPQEPRAQKAG